MQSTLKYHSPRMAVSFLSQSPLHRKAKTVSRPLATNSHCAAQILTWSATADLAPRRVAATGYAAATCVCHGCEGDHANDTSLASVIARGYIPSVRSYSRDVSPFKPFSNRPPLSLETLHTFTVAKCTVQPRMYAGPVHGYGGHGERAFHIRMRSGQHTLPGCST